MSTRDPFDVQQKPKARAAAPRAAAKKRNGAIGAEAARIAVVLRGIAEGNYDGRVDAETIEDPGLRAIAEAVNGAASAAVADLREAHQRAQIVTAGVDEAIEAMIRLVIQGDLSGLCRNKVKGRASASEITLFKSVGSAIEDLVAAILLWEKRGIG